MTILPLCHIVDIGIMWWYSVHNMLETDKRFLKRTLFFPIPFSPLFLSFCLYYFFLFFFFSGICAADTTSPRAGPFTALITLFDTESRAKYTSGADSLQRGPLSVMWISNGSGSDCGSNCVEGVIALVVLLYWGLCLVLEVLLQAVCVVVLIWMLSARTNHAHVGCPIPVTNLETASINKPTRGATSLIWWVYKEGKDCTVLNRFHL